MNEFLDQVNYYLQQAWVYLPMILSFITAFGLPTLVQLAKIFSSAKLYLGQVSKILKKVNESVILLKKMAKFMQESIDKEIAYLENLQKCTYNKKQQKLIEQRLLVLKDKKINALSFVIDEIKKEEVSKETIKRENKEAKKIKVRVKIKDEK